MESNWKSYLSNQIEHEISLQDISDHLKKMKQLGLKREEAKEYLNGLRSNNNDEAIEGRILEVLDIVEGFCNEKYIVW